MSGELKACPFCENRACVTCPPEHYEGEANPQHAVHCPGCAAIGPPRSSKAAAIAAWNRRAAQPSAEGGAEGFEQWWHQYSLAAPLKATMKDAARAAWNRRAAQPSAEGFEQWWQR